MHTLRRVVKTIAVSRESFAAVRPREDSSYSIIQQAAAPPSTGAAQDLSMLFVFVYLTRRRPASCAPRRCFIFGVDRVKSGD